jgi:ribosomal protein L11 methylase PrmA
MTRGCLIALDRLLKRRRPHCVLDVGTGTGILAIAAARALNGSVVASDMDPVAVAVAADNARKNGVQARVSVVQAEGLASGRSPFRQFAALAPARPCSRLCLVLRPGGLCVLSGILETRRGRSKRDSAPTASGSIRESFSMDGRRCCFGVAARDGRLPIDCEWARPYKAGPCFKASTRSARPKWCRSA